MARPADLLPPGLAGFTVQTDPNPDRAPPIPRLSALGKSISSLNNPRHSARQSSVRLEHEVSRCSLLRSSSIRLCRCIQVLFAPSERHLVAGPLLGWVYVFNACRVRVCVHMGFDSVQVTTIGSDLLSGRSCRGRGRGLGGCARQGKVRYELAARRGSHPHPRS